MILGCDVGGTKCNLALFEPRGERLEAIVTKRYPSNGFDRFEKIVAQFLGDAHADLGSAAIKLEAVGVGVAGPVVDGCVHATNLPWSVDAAALAKQVGTQHVVLLNDLEACGYSIELLRRDELATLNVGENAPRAAKVLIAAGTGLGEAVLYWDGNRYFVASSEGGHADLAPRTEQEIELLRHLKRTQEFVGFEAILSGRGFLAIHTFLDPTVKHPSFDQPGVDPAPEITENGLAGTCPVCVRTLDIWTALYGAEAGNLALKALARNGVYIAGGIAVKILPKLKDGTFVRAFRQKEKLGEMLLNIPIHVILNEKAPLLGAANQAALSVGT
jgi:glucokinase